MSTAALPEDDLIKEEKTEKTVLLPPSVAAEILAMLRGPLGDFRPYGDIPHETASLPGVVVPEMQVFAGSKPNERRIRDDHEDEPNSWFGCCSWLLYC